ncbi:unnamed protein product [Calypogeia fissa]
MSLSVLPTSLLSAPFEVQPTARNPPNGAEHGSYQPSCSLVAQFSSPVRPKVAAGFRQPLSPNPRLWNGEFRRKLGITRVAAAASASGGTLFPYFPDSAQKLLTELAETLDKELGPFLHASQTPSDVRYFKSVEGNAEGSIILRAGKDSKVDYTLESWLHATLPFGTLDIGTVVIMLGTELDSPHFLFEFILSGPVLVVVLDHLPRKDLVLDSAYLKRFYEDTELDKVRQIFEKAPDAKPYVSPVLFVRTVVSPTAAVFKISNNTEVPGGLLDEQIANVVHPGVTQALQVWLDSLKSRGLPVENKDEMRKRDNQIKDKGVEVDLSANLPRLFGQDITSKIVAAFRAGK